VPDTDDNAIIDNGGTANITSAATALNLTVGQSNEGYVNLSGNPTSSTLSVGQNLIVGKAGSGYFYHSGGKVTVGQDLILGNQAVSYGNYSTYQEPFLPVPELTVTGNIIVGHAGSGEFTHSAGTITASEVLLGYGPAGVGSYLLQGGTLTAQSLGVGFAGRGDFSQDGGEVNLNYLEVGGHAREHRPLPDERRQPHHHSKETLVSFHHPGPGGRQPGDLFNEWGHRQRA
jgi:hypothetical protein